MNVRNNEWKKNNIEKVRETRNKCVKNWKEANPEKRRAHSRVQKLKNRGELKQPEKCSWCGKETEDLIAHHIDYDAAENVIWFCRKCHGKMHRQN